MRGIRDGVFLFLSLCVFSVSGSAALVVDKQPNGSGGLNSNMGLDFERMADDFSISSPTQITAVTWYGWYLDGHTTADFDILFFDDSSSLPDDPAFYSTSVSGVSGVSTGIDRGLGGTVLQWTASIPTATFPSAGDYWISVQGRDAIQDKFFTYWLWGFADPPSGESGAASQREGETDWEGSSAADASYGTDAFAFRLEGTVVPVPAALPLLGSALAGVGLIGWRQRKAA